jgi:hypothetical protein
MRKHGRELILTDRDGDLVFDGFGNRIANVTSKFNAIDPRARLEDFPAALPTSPEALAAYHHRDRSVTLTAHGLPLMDTLQASLRGDCFADNWNKLIAESNGTLIAARGRGQTQGDPLVDGATTAAALPITAS